jgi:MFS family permease
MCIAFFALSVDRGTITRIPSTDVLQDFGITLAEFHTGQSVYFLSSLIAELPSQLVAKAVGFESWMPLQLIAWSLAIGAQTGINGPRSFYFIRSLIGIFEGGFVPSCVLYLSYYYTSSELPKRLSLYWSCYPIGVIISALGSWYAMHYSHLRAIPGWQWLSEIGGFLTFFLGCFAWLYLPSFPTHTASKRQRDRRWFTEKEEKIIVNRVLQDDPSKGDMRSTQALSLREVFKSLWDYHLWPIYLLGLLWHMAVFPVSQYFTENLRHMGYDALMMDLMVLPNHFLWMCNILIFTWVSEWLNERLLISGLSQVWVLPMLIAMVCLPTDRELTDTYALTLLLGAQPFVHAILTGLVSRNSGSVRTRTLSASIYNMCVQGSTVIGLWVSLPPDRMLKANH